MMFGANALPRWRFVAVRLGWPGWAGIAALLAGLAGVLVVAPQIRNANVESAAAIENLQHRIAHLQDPKAAQAARDPVGALVSRLPPSSAVSEFVAAIQRRAEEGAVQIDRTEYRVQPILGQAAQRYRLSFPANSDYPHLRAWLESLLHDYPNLTLDELSVRRAVDGGEELEAHVSVSFFVRDSK
jgi:hypothetical protein